MKRVNVMKGINIAVVSVFVLTIIYVIYNDFNSKEQIKTNLNEILVKDIYGKEVELINSSKNGVIINFWASWCTACVNELPLLNESYKQDQYDLLTVNIADNLAGIKKYVKRYDLVFPIIIDSEQFLKKTYSVSALPLTIVINNKGEVIERMQGELTNIDQIKQLKQMLK